MAPLIPLSNSYLLSYPSTNNHQNTHQNNHPTRPNTTHLLPPTSIKVTRVPTPLDTTTSTTSKQNLGSMRIYIGGFSWAELASLNSQMHVITYPTTKSSALAGNRLRFSIVSKAPRKKSLAKLPTCLLPGGISVSNQ